MLSAVELRVVAALKRAGQTQLADQVCTGADPVDALRIAHARVHEAKDLVALEEAGKLLEAERQ